LIFSFALIYRWESNSIFGMITWHDW
jgi:hypothetical protein